MKCPCKDCENRELLCHAKCSDYISWSNQKKEINRQKFLDKEAIDTQYKSISRMWLVSYRNNKR